MSYIGQKTVVKWFERLARRNFFNFLKDEEYIKIFYRIETGKKLNLLNPLSFNEKIQWLKLNEKREEYTLMVDKYRAKEYVSKRVGSEYVIPTLGVYETFEDIDFDKLPNSFVLKCTHDSGGVAIVKDKSNMNLEHIRAKINKSLKFNYYWLGREYPYKDIPKRIIAEKYMEDESGYELKDYKIFNFNGEPKVIQVDYDRFGNHMRNLYSVDWSLINGEICYPSNPDREIPRPESLDKMLTLASELSAGIPHVRTDFYSIGDKIYFGEMTFFHGSGTEEFRPQELEKEFGSWLNLPGGGYKHNNY